MTPPRDWPLQAAAPTPASPGSVRAADSIDLPSVIHLLRSAGGAMLVQLGLYGALAQVEWAQERNRLLGMLVATLLGIASLISLLLFTGALALALSWNTAYRLPVAVVLVALYAVGCALAWRKLRALSRRSTQSFSATRGELAADLAALKAML